MPRRGNRALLNKREKAGQPHDNLLRAVPYRISGPECGLFADAQAVFCDAHRRDPAGSDHLLRLHEPLVAAGLSASVSEKSPQGRQAHLVAEDAAMVRGRLPAHPPDRALRHLGRARHAPDAAAAGVLLLPRPCAAQEYLGQRRGRALPRIVDRVHLQLRVLFLRDLPRRHPGRPEGAAGGRAGSA